VDEAARTRLAAWLSEAAGAPVLVQEMALLSGGAVQQNWALDVLRGGQRDAWVLRTDNAAALSVSLPRTAEYALLRAARAAQELAHKTGTPCYVWQDGKIVNIGAPAPVVSPDPVA